MKAISFIILLFLFNSSYAKQKFYKWVDAQGNIHYSESKPANKKTNEVKIYNKISNENTQTYVSLADKKKVKEQESNGNKTKEQVAIDDFNKKEKIRVKKKQDAKNCKIAKQNLANLQKTVRVRRKNPKTGEVVRLDNSQRVKLLKMSKDSIKKLCR